MQYESPDESSDLDASPKPRSSPSLSHSGETTSRPALPPHAVPHRVASTPVTRSEMMAPVQDKERDDSALLQSPPAFVPAGLPNSSPHLFSAQRTPSPSSPGPAGIKDRLLRANKRQSSSHVVRETTLGLQHEDDEGARVVNQYKIGDSLGKGAYATVELGIDVSTGKKYVSLLAACFGVCVLTHYSGYQRVFQVAPPETGSHGASSAAGARTP